MGIDVRDVTAVIVTRGDVPLDLILATLPYPNRIVWDNSRQDDHGAYGRYIAADKALTPYVYFQDDDLIFREHEQLMANCHEGMIVCNMPSPWYETNQYHKLQQCMVGGGAICERGLYNAAIQRYLAVHSADALFTSYADEVVGMLTPYMRYDFGYEVLPVASAPGRTWNSPGAALLKERMRDRSLALR